MITREEVLAIEEYCAEHKVTNKARLAELGIQFWDFYKAKKKLAAGTAARTASRTAAGTASRSAAGPASRSGAGSRRNRMS